MSERNDAYTETHRPTPDLLPSPEAFLPPPGLLVGAEFWASGRRAQVFLGSAQPIAYDGPQGRPRGAALI
jgi:hypothetical protein